MYLFRDTVLFFFCNILKKGNDRHCNLKKRGELFSCFIRWMSGYCPKLSPFPQISKRDACLYITNFVMTIVLIPLLKFNDYFNNI